MPGSPAPTVSGSLCGAQPSRTQALQKGRPSAAGSGLSDVGANASEVRRVTSFYSFQAAGDPGPQDWPPSVLPGMKDIRREGRQKAPWD